MMIILFRQVLYIAIGLFPEIYANRIDGILCSFFF